VLSRFEIGDEVDLPLRHHQLVCPPRWPPFRLLINARHESILFRFTVPLHQLQDKTEWQPGRRGRCRSARQHGPRGVLLCTLSESGKRVVPTTGSQRAPTSVGVLPTSKRHRWIRAEAWVGVVSEAHLGYHGRRGVLLLGGGC
jgi:hypothetical protein